MVVYQRRRSESSSVYTGFSGDSVVSAITMDEDIHSGHSRKSLHRFGPKLHSLSEQKRASDPAEEEVKQCLDELRVPGRNNNRFDSCSEGEKQLCAIPRRRQSMEFSIVSAQPTSNSDLLNEEIPEDEDCDDDDDVSIASMETLEGSYYAYDFIEMGLDEIEYEMPIKECNDPPPYHGRPRRNYTRRRCKSTASSVSSADERSHAGRSRISASSQTRHTA